MPHTLSPKFLEIRQALETRHHQLTHRLTAIRGDLRQHDGPLDPDWSEQAQELENDEVLAGIEEASMVDLARIEHALKRMDEGKYGTCASCGEDIAAKRLAALPFVTMCIDCARQSEAR
jgi:DnaK suppressor protein